MFVFQTSLRVGQGLFFPRGREIGGSAFVWDGTSKVNLKKNTPRHPSSSIFENIVMYF
jgi:hypothetical protein